MSVFASGEELQVELTAFMRRFLESDDGRAGIEAARALGDSARLVVRTRDPETVLSVDVFAGTVEPNAIDEPDVELEIEADRLHDVLLTRLSPTQLASLYETDQLVFEGAAGHLGALILLAGPLQPHYPASLAERGREDLLAAAAPPLDVIWSSDGPPKQLIGVRRPWRGPKRATAA